MPDDTMSFLLRGAGLLLVGVPLQLVGFCLLMFGLIYGVVFVSTYPHIATLLLFVSRLFWTRNLVTAVAQTLLVVLALAFGLGVCAGLTSSSDKSAYDDHYDRFPGEQYDRFW
jgi:hypothetical protein